MIGSYPISGIPAGTTSLLFRLRNRLTGRVSGWQRVRFAEPEQIIIQEAPFLIGEPFVGELVEAGPGVYNGQPVTYTTLLVGGVDVGSSYTIQAGDDLATLQVYERADLGPSSLETVTPLLTITYRAPSLDAIAPQSANRGDPTIEVQATGSNLVGGVWARSGSPVPTISQTGLISISTAAAEVGSVTVTYTNSGGTASRTFSVVIASEGGGAWTPADMVGAFAFCLDFQENTYLTVNGSNQVTAASCAFASFTANSVNPAPWDSVNGALDLTAQPGRALDGAMPFSVIGPRVDGGSGLDATNAVTVLWVATGMTSGVVAGFRRSTGLARWRCGVGDLFGSTNFPSGWQTASKTMRIAQVRADANNTRTIWTWQDGAAGHTGNVTTSSGANTGTDSAGVSIGAMADGTSPANGRLHGIVVVRGVLNTDDRQRLEGWAAHRYGTTGALPADHPYKSAAPTVGTAPTPTREFPALTLYTGTQMEPLNLGLYWAGATSFSGVSLPSGLSVSGQYLIGKPSGTGAQAAFTVRASNASGNSDRTILITRLAAPGGAATTVPELWAKAAATTAGQMLTVAQSLTSTADRTLEALSALTGDTTLTLIGFTDFRDGAPSDVDYESRVAVPYTNSSGSALNSTGAALTAHPLFGAAGTGQWIDASGVSTAWPLDHLAGGVPVGLALGSYAARTMNSVGHNGQNHDGHIIWLAEYEDAAGNTITTWDELDNTKGRNPKLPLRHAARDATRLRRFATFRRASHAALKVNQVWQSNDPRTWLTPARRERHSYTPANTATTWAQVSTIIEALTATATTHVIGLPAVTMPAFTLTTAARNRLSAIRAAGGRVFLIGTPGQTIIPEADLTGCVGLDFGWVTFTRPDQAATQRAAVIRGGNCDVGFHGVVADGLDASFDVLGNPGAGASWTFADSYVGGINGWATSSGNAQRANPPRALFTRCLLDFANDGWSIYGPGSLRYESCYLMGSGGAYNNAGFLHNDIFGQNFGQNSLDEIRVAAWDNVLDSGPSAYIPDILRGAPSMVMMQGGRLMCYDFVGNILVQPVTGGGWGRNDSKIRRPEDGGTSTQAWWQNVHLAHNLFLFRPDLIRVPWGYPRVDWETIGNNNEASIDCMVATGNLLLKLPSAPSATRPSGGPGFSRAISIFPEENAFRTLDVATDLASFPAVSGTWAGGYTLDWSGTTYAGTSREGFIAPEDCVLSEAAREFGSSPIRGLPHDAAYIAANFTGLPADIRVHLGFVDSGGTALACGYPADWFGGYNPTAGTLNATIADPWGAGADDRALVVNTRLGTLSTGTIIEEVDAGDADRVWRLEVISEGGAHYPRWSMTDGSGAVIYRWTSAWPVVAGSHILASISTRYRPHAVESFQIPERIAALVYDHYVRAGLTTELSWVFEAKTTAPTIPGPTAGSTQVFIWCDLAADNAIKVWNGSAWVRPAEHLHDIAACMFLEEWNRITGAVGYALSSTTLGAMKWRLTLMQSLPGTITTVHTPEAPSATNARGDRIWAVTNGTVSTGPTGRSWTGTVWQAWNFAYEDTRVPGGEKAAAISVDGKAPVRRASDVWGTTDRFQISVDEIDARGPTFVADFDFAALDPSHVTVGIQCYRTTAAQPLLSFFASPRTAVPGTYTVDTAARTVTFPNLTNLLAPVVTQGATTGVAPLIAERTREDGVELDEAEANRVRVTISLAVNGDTLASLYEQETALPRGSVRIGGAAGAPYGGTLRYVEARRIAETEPRPGLGLLWRGPLSAANSSVQRHFMRSPTDVATGARAHPRLGAAEVWRRA